MTSALDSLRTLAEVAAEAGVAKESVRRWVRRLGITPVHRYPVIILAPRDVARILAAVAMDSWTPSGRPPLCPDCGPKGKTEFLRHQGSLTWCEGCGYEPPESAGQPVPPPHDYYDGESRP